MTMTVKSKLLNPDELEIKMSFTNYKLLKHEEFSLKGSYIYFVKGPNETGKTSILNALKAAHEIKDDTPQKVTIGETEGVAEFSLPGPDGKMYQLVYEFTDATTKFIMYDPDGNKISKITDMRDIFKYNHIDATSFISWSKTAEGRRKQKEFILELLTPEDYLNYKNLEQEEKEKFEMRTKVNAECDKIKSLRDENSLTSQEKEVAEKLDDAKKLLKAKEEEYTELTKTDDKRNEYLAQLIQIDARIESLNKTLNDYKEVQNRIVKNAEKRIEELQLAIELEKATIKSSNENIKAKENAYDLELNEINVHKSVIKSDLEKLPKQGDELVAKKAKLIQSIENGKRYIEVSNLNNYKLKKYDEYNQQYLEKADLQKELNDNITELRQKKEDIILNGKFPVKNLSFDNDGYLTINGLRFDEKQVCESDTILLVAQLMCRMNITPIQIIGDASLLDYRKLDILYDIAKENGKIMFVDEIDRESDKLVIVGYEKHSKEEPKKKNKKSELNFD